MERKLTIVVTCSDRKSSPAAQLSMVRNLPATSVADRVKVWTSRLAGAPARIPLRRLYQGETWRQVQRLERAALTHGWTPQILVVSAGLGLCRVDDLAPAYQATFTRMHQDAVGRTLEEARAWWQAITLARSPVTSTAGSGDVGTAMTGPAMWVLSDGYCKVVADDLLSRWHGEEVVVIGGSAQIPDLLRVRADRALRAALGGTVTSLNVRMATAWLDVVGDGPILSDHARRRWADWVATSRRPEQYERRPLSDAAVVSLVTRMVSVDPGISRSRALRQLRDAEYACEQRRFAVLFDQARRLRV